MGFYDMPKSSQEKPGKLKENGIGTHRRHWSAVASRESAIRVCVREAFERAHARTKVERDGSAVTVSWAGGDVLKTCSVSTGREILTAFPFIAGGIVHDVVVEAVDEWPDTVQGQVRGSICGMRFAFFDTYYPVNRERYRTGRQYRFFLSALAFRLKKTDDERSSHHEIEYSPLEGGEIDEFVFRTVVRDVRECLSGYGKAYLVTAPLFRATDGIREINIQICATESVTGGYVPAVGDRISGALWLQGFMLPRGGG